jgi:glutathione S-transferase
MITISAFKWVPEFAQGQVRDLRARWALEEAGGVRVRHMPITAEAVLAGLKKKA